MVFFFLVLQHPICMYHTGLYMQCQKDQACAPSVVNDLSLFSTIAIIRIFKSSFFEALLFLRLIGLAPTIPWIFHLPASCRFAAYLSWA